MREKHVKLLVKIYVLFLFASAIVIVTLFVLKGSNFVEYLFPIKKVKKPSQRRLSEDRVLVHKVDEINALLRGSRLTEKSTKKFKMPNMQPLVNQDEEEKYQIMEPLTDTNFHAVILQLSRLMMQELVYPDKFQKIMFWQTFIVPVEAPTILHILQTYDLELLNDSFGHFYQNVSANVTTPIPKYADEQSRALRKGAAKQYSEEKVRQLMNEIVEGRLVSVQQMLQAQKADFTNNPFAVRTIEQMKAIATFKTDMNFFQLAALEVCIFVNYSLRIYKKQAYIASSESSTREALLVDLAQQNKNLYDFTLENTLLLWTQLYQIFQTDGLDSEKMTTVVHSFLSKIWVIADEQRGNLLMRLKSFFKLMQDKNQIFEIIQGNKRSLHTKWRHLTLFWVTKICSGLWDDIDPEILMPVVKYLSVRRQFFMSSIHQEIELHTGNEMFDEAFRTAYGAPINFLYISLEFV